MQIDDIRMRQVKVLEVDQERQRGKVNDSLQQEQIQFFELVQRRKRLDIDDFCCVQIKLS